MRSGRWKFYNDVAVAARAAWKRHFKQHDGCTKFKCAVYTRLYFAMRAAETQRFKNKIIESQREDLSL